MLKVFSIFFKCFLELAKVWLLARLAVDPRFKGMENKFGAVYYNFPHAGLAIAFFCVFFVGFLEA